MNDLLDEMRAFFAPAGAFLEKATPETRAEANELLLRWDLVMAERDLEDGLYRSGGVPAMERAAAKLASLQAQGGSLRGRIDAGLVMAYAGLLKEDSGGAIIWISENLPGLAVPGNFELPKKREAEAWTPLEEKLLAATQSYVSQNGHPAKPDLQPLAKADMLAVVLQAQTLLHYRRGHFEEVLKLARAQLAHAPAHEGLARQLWMLQDSVRRLQDNETVLEVTTSLLESRNLPKPQRRDVLHYNCAARIDHAPVIAARELSAGLDFLVESAEFCRDIPDKAAEAWYRAGEIAAAAKDLERARMAFGNVLRDFKGSRFEKSAQKALLRLK
jgi:tetratricopeptide (TPR) repeat protein